MQRTQAEIKDLYQHLINAPMYWFDPRAGQENINAHAWRAVAYYLSGVETNSAYLGYTNDVLFEYEADKFAKAELIAELQANNIP